jgi:hypothetical protein
MISSRYAICATRIIQDANENKMTLVDVLEELGSPGYPLVLPRTSFVWVLTREPGDPSEYGGAIVVRQRDRELGRFRIAVNFQQALFARTVLVVGGLVVPEAGRIAVTFEITAPVDLRAVYYMDATSIPQVVGQAQGPSGTPTTPAQGGAGIAM